MTAAGSDERRDTWREDLEQVYIYLSWVPPGHARDARQALARVAGELERMQEVAEHERGHAALAVDDGYCAACHVSTATESLAALVDERNRLREALTFRDEKIEQMERDLALACQDHEILERHNLKRAEAAEQEVARLRDGLRQIADHLWKHSDCLKEIRIEALSLLSGGQAENTKEQG